MSSKYSCILTNRMMKKSSPKRGWVYLVGAGPGDPGLITVRALELLQAADVVVYDHLISDELLDEICTNATRVYVGKHDGKHTLPQEEISRLLIAHAGAGSSVVRLKGGDPFVFGRGAEEALALVEAVIPFEVVPGVTAAVAAAAYGGIPLTHRELASSVSLITGHECSEKSESSVNWDALANSRGTLAFYMPVKNLPNICTDLIASGLDRQTPAAAIHWGTTAKQRVLTGTVENLPEIAKAADLQAPTLLVIGEVVRLRDRLTWFSDES